MRIGFVHHFSDKHWLGGRNYFHSLFSSIRAAGGSTTQVVFFTGYGVETNLPDQFPWMEVVRTKMLDRGTPHWFARQLGKIPSNHTLDPVFDRLFLKYRVDVLSHAWGTGSKSKIRSVAWLPDFQFRNLPEFWTPKQQKSAAKKTRAAIQNADSLILSSYSALADLRSFSSDDTTPAHVLHFVANPIDLSRIAERASLVAKYQLPDRFFLLPNQFWAAKNHALVLDALQLLAHIDKSITVVCTGKTDDGRNSSFFADLMQRCKDIGVENQFRVLGIVPYIDLQGLMLHCQAVLNPSMSEGWSTTVEEAKLLGKPLLLSDIPVHREQLPGVETFYDPTDSSRLSELLQNYQKISVFHRTQSDINNVYRTSLLEFGKCYMNILESTISNRK